MNEENLHNNPWAKKLEQAKVPEADESWKEMNVLLDKEMPLAYQNYRTKLVLVTVFMLLVIGVCNCPAIWNNHRLGQKSIRGKIDTGKGDNKTNSKLRDSDSIAGINALKLKKNTIPGKNADTSGDRLLPLEETREEPGTGQRVPSVASQKVYHGKGQIEGQNSPSVTDKRKSIVGVTSRPTGDDEVRRQNHKGNSRDRSTGKDGQVLKERKNPQKIVPTAADKVSNNITGRPMRSVNPGGDDLISNRQDDVITDKAISSRKPETSRVSGVPGQPVALVTDSAAKLSKTPPRKDRERFWSVGIGLNQFFPINEQERSGFNSSGTSGVISDYIPVPQVSYYLDKKLYIQLEAQFNTPQYTKELVAKQVVSDTNSQGQRTKSSVVIEKLFYMNFPLSVHYSPVKNFYIGAGLQFSSLNNGVGLFEDRALTPNFPDSIRRSKVQSLKTEDSVYSQLKTNEWRFLIDYSYQWKNITLGLRYNKALTDFINIQISNTEITQARNSSLQLYMRYRIWRTKK